MPPMRRAVDIHGTYELAAPILGAVNTAPAIDFLRKVRELVRSAVVDSGGEMRP